MYNIYKLVHVCSFRADINKLFLQGPIYMPQPMDEAGPSYSQDESGPSERMDETGPAYSVDEWDDILQTPLQPPSYVVEENVWDTAARMSMEATRLSMEADATSHDVWQGLPHRTTRGQPAPRWSPSG